MSNLKFLKNDYAPTGEIAGFPLEIIDKMIDYQVQQGNKANVTVFEKNSNASENSGGFNWSDSDDGIMFWHDVIDLRKFDIFFRKYPKKGDFLPRVIEVRNSEDFNWTRRVVFAFKNGKALCWNNAETLEEAKNETQTTVWNYWREIKDDVQSDELEYEAFDFSNGVSDYSYIIDKIIINKNNNMMFKIVNLFYDDILKSSHINDFECENLFKHYTFEDGSPVGVRIN